MVVCVQKLMLRERGIEIMGLGNRIEINGEIKHETDAAYLFYDGAREVWLPKSKCEWNQDSKVMMVPEWLAMDKELL